MAGIGPARNPNRYDFAALSDTAKSLTEALTGCMPYCATGNLGI